MSVTKEGLMISVSGPSGVGKGTVIGEIRKMFPNAKHSISVTTRAPRGEEKDGVEYYFRTREEFENLVKEGEILEYDEYVGNYYGTPLTPLVEQTKNGNDVLLDITIAGSLALEEKYPSAVTIFILPPSLEELSNRLRGRGTESEELISKRMEMAKKEILCANKFDYVVVNDELSKTVDNIASIIKAEKLRYDRNNGIEKTL